MSNITESNEDDSQIVVIDYLELMSKGKPVATHQIEVGEFSRQLRRLSKNPDNRIDPK